MFHLVASGGPTPGRHVTAMRRSAEQALANVAAGGGDLAELVQEVELRGVRGISLDTGPMPDRNAISSTSTRATRSSAASSKVAPSPRVMLPSHRRILPGSWWIARDGRNSMPVGDRAGMWRSSARLIVDY
jgi:hypothetical protein